MLRYIVYVAKNPNIFPKLPIFLYINFSESLHLKRGGDIYQLYIGLIKIQYHHRNQCSLAGKSGVDSLFSYLNFLETKNLANSHVKTDVCHQLGNQTQVVRVG